MNELASILNAIMRRLADIERRLAQITTPFSGAVSNLFGLGTAVLRAAAGQTADILQAQNSSGTALASISASGVVRGASFAIQGGASGASGTFTTADGKTVTVSGGIITEIV